MGTSSLTEADRAFVPAMVGAMIVPLSLFAVINDGLEMTPMIAVVVVVAAFLLLLSALRLGRGRGLATLWSVLLLLWALILVAELRSPAVLPRGLVAWDLAAVPLLAASHVYKADVAPSCRGWHFGVCAAWLIMSALAACLAQYPLEFGTPMGPYLRPVALNVVVFGVAPFTLSLDMIRHLWGRQVP
jgi:hypothetical protein